MYTFESESERMLYGKRVRHFNTHTHTCVHVHVAAHFIQPYKLINYFGHVCSQTITLLTQTHTQRRIHWTYMCLCRFLLLMFRFEVQSICVPFFSLFLSSYGMRALYLNGKRKHVALGREKNESGQKYIIKCLCNERNANVPTHERTNERTYVEEEDEAKKEFHSLRCFFLYFVMWIVAVVGIYIILKFVYIRVHRHDLVDIPIKWNLFFFQFQWLKIQKWSSLNFIFKHFDIY